MRMLRILGLRVALALALGSLGAACASAPGPYRTTQFAKLPDGPQPAGGGGIVRGAPAPVIDALNHYLFSLPAKLLYVNPRLQDHALPPESERLLREYLIVNGLQDKVLIRHNQWAPLDEWRRLRANTDVAAIYRYTIGLYYVGYYTLLPPRLFGGSFLSLGDRFSPYTNSISIYTSDPAFLLHEGGHAKDYQQVRYKGTWGAFLEIPVGALIYEYTASRDAVRFVHCRHRGDLERSFYRHLTPAYGSYIGGYASYLVPGGQLVVAAGIVVGHVVGQIQAGVRRVAVWIRPDDESASASGAGVDCTALLESAERSEAGEPSGPAQELDALPPEPPEPEPQIEPAPESPRPDGEGAFGAIARPGPPQAQP
jgi:hypothetical protein